MAYIYLLLIADTDLFIFFFSLPLSLSLNFLMDCNIYREKHTDYLYKVWGIFTNEHILVTTNDFKAQNMTNTW